MILSRMLGLVAPYIMGAMLLVTVGLAINNMMLRRANADLTADVEIMRGKLARAEMQIDSLRDGIDRQNAGIEAQAQAGRERLEATTGRLQAFPAPDMPPGFGAPLTGVTECDRAQEVRGRILDMIGAGK